MMIEATVECPTCHQMWEVKYPCMLALRPDQTAELTFTCRSCYGAITYRRAASEPPAMMYAWSDPHVLT